MEKEFKTKEDLDAFIEPLYKEEKYLLDILQLPENAGFRLRWVEHKRYTSYTGESFPDEVWLTKDDRLLFIQDIEPEHCRNILRMILRNRRQQVEVLQEVIQTIVDSTTELLNDQEDHPPRILH